MKNEIEIRLCEGLEALIGHKMQTRRDFDMLAEIVLQRTGERISPTTLRRFWGYQEQDDSRNTALHTLNQLSRTISGKDWDAYCALVEKQDDAENSSDFIIENMMLRSESLVFGDKVELTWAPNRRVTIEFQGNDVFRVIMSEHSKLEAGDTFCCTQFVAGEPLVCHSLIRPGMATASYVCGKQGGIRWRRP